MRGAPEHIRSDNGPEFVAKEVQRWLGQAQVRTLYIQKASPWENGYVESFNGKLRDELLNRELFLGLEEARVVLGCVASGLQPPPSALVTELANPRGVCRGVR